MRDNRAWADLMRRISLLVDDAATTRNWTLLEYGIEQLIEKAYALGESDANAVR